MKTPRPFFFKMDDGQHKLRSSGGLQCNEPIVKLEPPEDIKDITTSLNFFNNSSRDVDLDKLPNDDGCSTSNSILWPYLLKSVRLV